MKSKCFELPLKSLLYTPVLSLDSYDLLVLVLLFSPGNFSSPLSHVSRGKVLIIIGDYCHFFILLGLMMCLYLLPLWFDCFLSLSPTAYLSKLLLTSIGIFSYECFKKLILFRPETPTFNAGVIDFCFISTKPSRSSFNVILEWFLLAESLYNDLLPSLNYRGDSVSFLYKNAF